MLVSKMDSPAEWKGSFYVTL